MKSRMTLRTRLMLTMTLLVAGMIGLCWLINGTFLEKYYALNKQREMLEGYNEIYQASSDGTLRSAEFDIPFERICSNGNISILITDEYDYPIRFFLNDSAAFQREYEDVYKNPLGGNAKIVDQSENYTLIQREDKRMDDEYLILAGKLSNGESIIMRSAVESIYEVASITNRFFLLIGLGIILIGLVVIYFVSRSISRPIMNMTALSKQMSDLQFDAKYNPGKSDSREIHELGVHMNQMSETLEKTIAELKTANAELKQDIQKKEEIDEMRKEFLSNVSHELKTPIALVQGYAEGLQECINDDAESREFYCEVIIDEAEKMNNMVKKLLTLNQLEFGSNQLDMERFDLTDLCSGVIASNRLLAEQSGAVVEFLSEGACYTWGDAFKVEEVITNYLTNAIHYALGGKKIRVWFTQKEGLIRLSVFNEGKQIPEEEQDKIWIKFYKVDKARTREYGGSGIGLSIVKAIMDSMHQKCGVINHEDGVEFWMELEKA